MKLVLSYFSRRLTLLCLCVLVVQNGAADTLPQAQVLFARGDYAAADAIAQSLQQKNPTNFAARLLRFEVAEILGDTVEIEAQRRFLFYVYNSGTVQSNALALTAIATCVRGEDPHGAWRAFSEAQAADPDRIDTYLRAATHCVERYAWALATKQYQHVLSREPQNAEALTGLAGIALMQSQYDAAQMQLDAVYAASNAVPDTHLVQAALHILDRDYTLALARIQTVLTQNARHPDALTMLATVRACEGDADAIDAAVARAQALNPKNGDAFCTVAQSFERLMRFPDAVTWARKAMAVDPPGWQGAYIAGMNLLRMGEESEGYDLLNTAFQRNSFNIWAYNTLTVLDRDLRKGEYAVFTTPHFAVKIDRKEADILWPYVGPALEAAYTNYSARYDVTPVGPEEYGGKILVLIFPTHQEFSARTVGLPGMGASGACFGRVITMPSPRPLFQRGEQTRLHWMGVLEHELLHVMTLQKTQYRISRWLTEGISTYIEQDPQIALDGLLAMRARHGGLPSLDGFNRHFTRPTSPVDVPLAYYQASLACRYIEDRIGEDGMRDLLRAIGSGSNELAAVSAALGESIEAIDAGISNLVVAHTATVPLPNVTQEGAKTPSTNLATTASAVMGERWERALELTEALCAETPDDWRAHWLRGRALMGAKGDLDEALRRLTRACELDASAYPARLELGRLHEARSETEAAEAAYRRAHTLAPRHADWDAFAGRLLAELLQREARLDEAAAVMQAVCEVHRHLLPAHLLWGDLLLGKGDADAASDVFLNAVHMNPYSMNAHTRAIEALEQTERKAELERERQVREALQSARKRGTDIDTDDGTP